MQRIQQSLLLTVGRQVRLVTIPLPRKRLITSSMVRVAQFVWRICHKRGM
ncbi:Uncharacterised protein [Vibrio cholerae]|nr:Uncharacterised protein [Vibrio cholerae]